MRKYVILYSLTFGLIASTAVAGVPSLQSGINVYDGASLLNAGVNSRPFVVDWNNDGKKDLLVGSSGGKIRLYLNQGTATAPVYSGSSCLRASGVDILLPFTGG